MGQILSDEGHQEEAINCLIDALRWDSKNHWALLMMGNIQAKFLKDVPTGLKYYDQALLVNPTDYITLSNVAYLLFQENRLEDAKKQAWEALRISDNYPNAHFILALIAEKENDLHSAFYSSIQSLKFAKETDELYQNGFRKAFEIARTIATDFEGKKIFYTYKSQLEKEGGIPIAIDADDTIKTAAKIEFAERYHRDKHHVKYKSTYPAVEHLVMHEMTHLDFVIQARAAQLNQLFISTPENKQNFLASIQPAILKLKNMGLDEAVITTFSEGIFDGMNLQTYNTPIDVFIEDFLYKEYAELRPYQFLSLYNLLEEAVKSVTDERIIDLIPAAIIAKTKIYSLVNALQFDDLFGVNRIEEFKATPKELQQAEAFYTQFLDRKDHRKPGEEFELVRQWAKALELDNFFALENEYQLETKTNIDDFLEQLQQDPFGLNDTEDPQQVQEMADFQKAQEEIGLNTAVVMFMVEALQYFKAMPMEAIKKIAFEIAILGQQGIDTETQNYIVSSIPNKRFSGYQLLSFYYVSWALSVPEHVGELGLDYKDEYEMAIKMVNN
jgi:tetratricopeptide (TPR) repeat protein